MWAQGLYSDALCRFLNNLDFPSLSPVVLGPEECVHRSWGGTQRVISQLIPDVYWGSFEIIDSYKKVLSYTEIPSF